MRPLQFLASNLLSIEDVNLDLMDRGLLLVTGYSFDEQNENGAGKSNVAANALIWTMYGFTPNDIRSDEVINCHNPDDKAYGIFIFEATDKITYMINRQRNPNSLILQRQSIEDPDWIDISDKTVQQTQVTIDRLLGKSRQAFLQTAYFGNTKSMNYARLTGLEQREVLESILPIEDFQGYVSYASKILLDLEEEIYSIRQEIAKTQGRIVEIIYKIQELKTLSVKFNSAKRDKLNGLILQLKARPDISDLKSQEILEGEYKHLHVEGTLVHTKFVQVEQQINSFVPIKQNQLCPTCKQFINRDYTDEDVNAHNKIKEDLEDERQSLHLKYQDLRNTNEQVVRELNIHNQYNQYNGIEKEYERVSMETDPYPEQCIRSENHKQDLEKRNSDLKSKSTLLESEINHIQIWVKAFSKDIKLSALASVCPFLDARTNHHLAQLQNSQLHIAFSTVKMLISGEAKEDFNVQVWSDTGGKSFKALSNGEQRIVSFAIGLALGDLADSKTSGQCKLMILDEPFVQLSAKNAESIIQYITNTLGKDKDTILLISNEEHLKSLIHDRVHVIKQNGMTTLDGAMGC